MIKFLILLLTFASINLIGQEMNINIIPTPQKIELSESNSKFTFNKSFRLEISNNSIKSIEKVTNFLNNEISAIKYLTSKSESTIKLTILESYKSEDQIPNTNENEAYILQLAENEISLKAISAKGLFYAAQSLIQLIKINQGQLAPCKIVDWPDLKFRGISDDISRGQVSTLDNFKRIIKFLARYKMNTYMPYIEDMIEFKSYPSIGKDRGALTYSEIKEIVKFADDHFIEVIPIFQTLGHYENILSQNEFIHLADFPGAASLDVTNEETYKFLETLLSEVFELFPSKYFHMGADESYDVGFGNSKKLAEQTDLATVHANHYKRVYDICKKYDKEVMMYGDIILSHPEILEKIPKDITIVDWHYFPRFNYPSTKIFDDAGFKYIVSQTVWNFNTAFPENFLAIPNIETLTEEGIRDSTIGMINSCWGDYGAETFKELNLYGYAWSAQCAWNIDGSNSNTFTNSFFNDFYGTNEKSLNTIYNELSDPSNQVLWNDFWRHPLLDFRTPDWRQFKIAPSSKVFWMNKEIDHNLFANARKSISRNAEHFDLVEYAFKLKNYFGSKLKTQKLLLDIIDGKNVDIENCLNLVEENITSLKTLKSDFRKYWLRTNKENNLWMIDDKFDRLINAFREAKDNISNQTLTSPRIDSKYIIYPTEDGAITDSVIFKYEINISGEVESALIQLIAEGSAKLYINDQYVDQVYVKRSGSILVEQQRVKLIDIKNFLKQKNNIIRVEAKNYKLNNASINVNGNITAGENVIKIESNEDWKVKKINADEWTNAKIDETNTLEIIAPDFSSLRKSWIER